MHHLLKASKYSGALLLLLVATVGKPPRVAAQEFSGNDIYERCASTKQENINFCYGYIMGVRDGLLNGAAFSLSFTGTIKRGTPDREIIRQTLMAVGICHPPTASNGQDFDIVVDYLRKNPQTRHEVASSLVHTALRVAYPC